jgi:hypothetical protein
MSFKDGGNLKDLTFHLGLTTNTASTLLRASLLTKSLSFFKTAPQEIDYITEPETKEIAGSAIELINKIART